MPPIAPSEDFAQRCGLEAVSESVRRLAQIVSQPDATTDQVAKLIVQDKAFTARLLRAANPRAACAADYTCTTVSAALQRTGMSSVLLLAMYDPLLRAVQKTFLTMLGVELSVIAAADAPFSGEHIRCDIAFAGKATGAASLRLTTPTALLIAARVLGVPLAEVSDPAVMSDVIGELGNMVVGNFKSNLCDAGLKCKLFPPAITRTADLKMRSTPDSLAERIGFHARDFNLLVDLNVNPWG